MPIKGRHVFFSFMLLGELPLLMPLMICALFFGVLQAAAGVVGRLHDGSPGFPLSGVGRRPTRGASSG